jgi:hypothetical protein
MGGQVRKCFFRSFSSSLLLLVDTVLQHPQVPPSPRVFWDQTQSPSSLVKLPAHEPPPDADTADTDPAPDAYRHGVCRTPCLGRSAFLDRSTATKYESGDHCVAQTVARATPASRPSDDASLDMRKTRRHRIKRWVDPRTQASFAS